MDQWQGDCPRAIDHAAALPVGGDGGRYIDINFQVCLSDDGKYYVAMGVHSETAALNGFHYIRRRFSPLRRPMTHAELHRPTKFWRESQMKRWRRTSRRSRGVYESRVRPYSFAELVGYAKGNAKRKPVTICSELKSRLFASHPEIAIRMKSQVAALKTTVYPMTLVTMPGWQYKMRNFHNAGFETALLAHGAPRPADLPLWRKYIDAIWGSFS